MANIKLIGNPHDTSDANLRAAAVAALGAEATTAGTIDLLAGSQVVQVMGVNFEFAAGVALTLPNSIVAALGDLFTAS